MRQSCVMSCLQRTGSLHNFLNFPLSLYYLTTILACQCASTSLADVFIIDGKLCTCFSGQGLIHRVTLSITLSWFLSYTLTSVCCLWSICNILKRSTAAKPCNSDSVPTAADISWQAVGSPNTAQNNYRNISHNTSSYFAINNVVHFMNNINVFMRETFYGFLDTRYWYNLWLWITSKLCGLLKNRQWHWCQWNKQICLFLFFLFIY